MIYLVKGQKLYDNPGFVVYEPTGYYEDEATVICSGVDTPEEPVCRYEAKFIAYGAVVYNIAEPSKLLEEIRKIDPETLFSRTKDDIAIQQVVDNINTVDQNIETETPIETPNNTNTSTSANVDTSTNTQTSTTESSTTTPETISTDTSTSTPSIDTGTSTPPIDIDTSTSTPVIDTGTSTTTDVKIDTIQDPLPEILPKIEPDVVPIDTSTTTPSN